MEQARRLEPIDLLRLYGNIEFDWCLVTDHIEWFGPLNRLISPEVSLVTGSSYNNLLSPDNLLKRLQGLTFDSLSESEEQSYSARYRLSLPNYETAEVCEEGTLCRDHTGSPLSLSGFIRFTDQEEQLASSTVSDGYDPWTGFPTKEILFENLASFLEQSKQSQMPGAYLSLSLDCLTHISCLYGPQVVQDLFKQVAETLRSSIRFNDTIGRTSCCCFGLILKDCDRWGVVRAAQRLVKNLKETTFQTSAGPLKIKVSAGGLVFPEPSLTAVAVMRKAEHYLFDAQSLAGSGSSWTPYGEGIQDLERPKEEDLERSKGQGLQARRATDLRHR